MKIFGLMVILMMLAACNTTDGSNQQQVGTTVKSGIEGTVMIGPSCPVQRVDDPSCDDQPYQGWIHVNTTNGMWVTKFQADKQGIFKIELEPGLYNIDPQTPKEGFLPRASSQDVTVKAGNFTRINIQYDSGIR
jgi:predicted small secreted protein